MSQSLYFLTREGLTEYGPAQVSQAGQPHGVEQRTKSVMTLTAPERTLEWTCYSMFRRASIAAFD